MLAWDLLASISYFGFNLFYEVPSNPTLELTSLSLLKFSVSKIDVCSEIVLTNTFRPRHHFLLPLFLLTHAESEQCVSVCVRERERGRGVNGCVRSSEGVCFCKQKLLSCSKMICHLQVSFKSPFLSSFFSQRTKRFIQIEENCFKVTNSELLT